MRRLRLGEFLVSLGLVSEAQLATALAYQSQWNCKLGEALVYLRMLAPEQVQRALARQLRVPFIRGEELLKVPASMVRSVPADVLTRLKVCPLRLERQGTRGVLYVATHQPENLPLLDELAFLTGFSVRPVLALLDDVERTLRHHAIGEGAAHQAIELPADEGFHFEVTPGSQA